MILIGIWASRRTRDRDDFFLAGRGLGAWVAGISASASASSAWTCGIGQLSIALKERFSQAEIWGVDVAAPMIRYGHMRAVDLDVDVNFAQRLAEDSKFPDNHFDIVTSYILHHEVTAEASKQIIAEAFRVLRPGGVYFPIDFFTGGRRRATAHGTFREWVDHRWNNEV